MANQKHQKYSLNNRILAFLAILLEILPVFPLSAIAFADNENTNPLLEWQLISHISYEYEILRPEHGDIDCMGVLRLTVPTFENLEMIIISQSIRYQKEGERIRWGLRTLAYPESQQSDILIPNVFWGTFFKVNLVFNDGTQKCTPTYFINEYISYEDLKQLQPQADMGTGIEKCDIDMKIQSTNLVMETSDPLQIYVTDLSGKLIFSGEIHDYIIIPLHDVPSPFIIVKAYSHNQSITKKILIK